MNAKINKLTRFIDLGIKDYRETWDYQDSLFQKILSEKRSNQQLPPDQQTATPNFLVFCEHPHVFTLGKSGDRQNLLVSEETLESLKASYYQINRGGDITYHGPGQLVAYPILDLENFFTDIHRYMRTLEEAVIQTLEHFGISSGRIPGLTGVWMNAQKESRKICALGVKTSRWVTLHGLALNVYPNLDYFQYIIPCGIQDKSVTSMEKELGFAPDLEEVKKILKLKIGELFEMEWES